MKSIRTLVFNYFFYGITLFFILIVAVVIFFSKKMVNSFVYTDHHRSLQYLTLNISDNWKRDLETLESLGSILSVSEGDPRLIKSKLKDFLNYSNLFSSIHVYHSDGKLMTHAARKGTKPYKPENSFYQIQYADEGLVKSFEAAVSGSVSQSQVYTSDSGFVFQAYFVPVFEKASGKVQYVVSGAIAPKVQDLSYFVSGFQLYEKNFILLLSSNNKLIAKSKNVTPSILSQVQDIDLADNNLEQEIDSHKLLISKLTTTGQWLVMGVSHEIAYSKINRILKYLALVVVFSVFFSLIVSYFLGARLSRPFSLVMESLKQLHLGNFKHRINYSQEDETGYLCHLVDEMAVKLEKDQYLGEFWTNEEELERIKKGEKR